MIKPEMSSARRADKFTFKRGQGILSNKEGTIRRENICMKKPSKTMQQLKATQKRRIAEWLYAAILKSMAETGAKPDEAAMLQLATGVQQRFQALRVAYTLEEAQQYVKKRIERDCERAAQELEQRKPLTEQVKIPVQGAIRERAQWAQSFPREIGTGNALIKAYKRRYGLTRITALKELQSLGYSFSQQVIERQYRIVEQEKQQLARRKQKKKRRKEQQYSCSFAPDQDETFFYIAGYTSGGAPYGVTWEEMGISSCEELEENVSLEMLSDELEDDYFK